MSLLLQVTNKGLYCETGDFYIDPWGSVDQAVITHAHSDHATPGSRRYLTSRKCEPLLRARVGPEPFIASIQYGQAINWNGVRLSLHPAGHILGSAQVRIEYRGEVWVVSGDYKLEPDPTCSAFEPLPCHTFVTESTFGLPIFRWPVQADIFSEIHSWWRANQESGRSSVLFVYPLGKAQRVLAGLDRDIGPIFTHGAIENYNLIYRESGIQLAPTTETTTIPKHADWSQALVVAPPYSQATPWLRRFGSHSTAFASGWMRIRGARRRRALDRGFVLSDHADWPGLMTAICETGAERILVTHGYRDPLVQWLREKGFDAHALPTRFEGERDETAETDA